MTENSKRPFILYTTPRSGSTPLYEAILEVSEHRFGHEGLSEYLNWHYIEAWEEAGRIVLAKKDETPSWPTGKSMTKIVTTHLEASEQIAYRVNLLKKYPDRYTFKVFSTQFSHNHRDSFWWLSENYRWIFLERKDIFEQLLSHLISFARNVWYEQVPVRVPDGSLVAHKVFFDMLETGIKNYLLAKKMMNPKHILSYEEFCGLGPRDVLMKAGIDVPTECTFEKCNGVPVQNGKDKIELFANKDEIIKWFNESSLSSLVL